jgi:3',5'-cyclic AMP phosphodiesterase CpdA
MKLKIGIISDLHCHQLAKYPEEIEYEKTHEKFYKKEESYIITDKPLPLYQDPYLSFKELIKKKQLKGLNLDVDLLIMPGDLGNKSCPEGIKKGWEITQEIGNLMKAKNIVSTIGNHDVDSRNIFGSNSFNFIKGIKPNFPSKDKKSNYEFWQKGYVIMEFDSYRILVINSVHSHTNKEQAEHGLFTDEALIGLEEELQDIRDSKLGIAVCHHSPMEHSRIGSKNNDLMYNGDQLIPLLDLYNFEIIIHGHKHDPMLRYGGGGGDSSLVFSAGSFSAIKDILPPAGGANTFHIVELTINKNARSFGTIETWFFIPTKGWKNEFPNPYFKNKVGFGTRIDIKEKAQEILIWFQKSTRKQLLFLNEFLPNFDELNYLIPIDFDRLIYELGKKNIIIGLGDINENTKIELIS